MELTLISTNQVADKFFFSFLFKNDLDEKGLITVAGDETITVEEKEYLVLSIVGRNTFGNAISVNILYAKEAEVNPTKVFNFIVKKLKEVLCPKCM